MPICKYCGDSDLVWGINELGNWQLRVSDGNWHDCKPTEEQREQMKNDKEKKCKHGIAKDWFCKQCVDERVAFLSIGHVVGGRVTR